MTFITRPTLPPFYQYAFYLSKLWRSRILTNDGYYSHKFLQSLKNYLHTPDIALTSNATSALEISLRSLNLKPGTEVITTSFSFVATSNAIINAGLVPVFVDTKSLSGNLCVQSVENATTANTGAILAVHVYGIPADHDGLAFVAKKYSIPLLYDGAHAFGVKLNGTSLLSIGDLSICSFHATKVFNCGEGGCIIGSASRIHELKRLANFGFCSENDISSFGGNAKMDEMSALLGFLNVKYIASYIRQRRSVFESYISLLNRNLLLDEVFNAHKSTLVEWNYSYMPITFVQNGGSCSRDLCYDILKKHGIFTRKYFSPLIYNTSAYQHNSHLWRYHQPCTNAQLMCENILCLPLYPGLKRRTISKICSIISNVISS